MHVYSFIVILIDDGKISQIPLKARTLSDALSILFQIYAVERIYDIYKDNNLIT